MLHEILLSLSGHPSALFDAVPDVDHVTSTASHLLSPPEAELLSSIGQLSRLHRQIREHVTRIAATHPSTVCRAAAASIISHHLALFQRKILEVESRILKQDASTVGAYNIVPLAGVVNDFSEWIQLLEWLWDLSSFVLSPEALRDGKVDNSKASSGSQLIDKLRAEAQTGYPNIGEAACYLGDVAEQSWLRQLSTWLLYGRLPSFGASDFFIQQEHEHSEGLSFRVDHSLLPKFVTRHTASSILFVGRSLNQIRSIPPTTQAIDLSPNVSELDLLPGHVEALSRVRMPIAASELAEAVKAIRLSLSRNLLQHLLPRTKIIETLTVLHQFFLLAKGEFAVALIAEADKKRLIRSSGLETVPKTQTMQGVMLKEAEISQTLARTLAILSTLADDDEHIDDILDVASRVLRLAPRESQGHRPGTPGRAKDADSMLPRLTNASFDQLLLSTPCSLVMETPYPLDLFVSRSDLDAYATINAYLLAVRRAHLHLAQLWRQSSIRREHPCPPGYQYSNTAHGKSILKLRRQRTASRFRSMRKVWATCAASVLFLAESETYFQGAVIQESFNHFLKWVNRAQDPPISASHASHSPSQQPQIGPNHLKQQHDPEALSHAHRQFLSWIAYSLLLTDAAFPRLLYTLCTHVDELAAYITRLTDIQQNLDLAEDEGIEKFTRNYLNEENEVKLELDRARRRLDSDLKGLVERLRDIDNERSSTSAPKINAEGQDEDSIYVPARTGGVDRLLMKLDWDARDKEDEDVELLKFV
ncbi:gamma-tubulin complex component protein [Paraphoma chrysanthemicola]|nr:gamma-tubulin complex component protein [Paraphoma chrysanthemicola]